MLVEPVRVCSQPLASMDEMWLAVRKIGTKCQLGWSESLVLAVSELLFIDISFEAARTIIT